MDASWRIGVFICHNQRDSGAGRASCGEVRGASLARALRRAVRERGWKEQILCTRSGCLDICSREGTTVIVWPADGGERQVLVVPDVEALDGVMERLVQLVEGTPPERR